MREIVHIQAGQCGNQIGAKVRKEKRHLRVDSWKKFYAFFCYHYFIEIDEYAHWLYCVVMFQSVCAFSLKKKIKKNLFIYFNFK